MITPQQAYQASKDKGFYDPIPSKAQRLVLIIGELSEAVEAIRANKWFSGDPYPEQVKQEYQERKSEVGIRDAYAEYIKGSVEEEIADTYIRVLDYMGFKGYVFEEKEADIPVDTMEAIFLFMENVVYLDLCDGDAEGYVLNNILADLRQFARNNNFDLEWHVEQKFLYNQSRPFKHGKQF